MRFIVEEGDRVYPIDDAWCGWGVLSSRRPWGRVLAVSGPESEVRLHGESEIRLSASRPWRNAAQFRAAADALLAGGGLHPQGRPMPALVSGSPRPGAPDAVRWAMTSLLPSLWNALMARFGPEPQMQWGVGVLRGLLPTAPAFPWNEVRWLVPPTDAIVADPFIVRDAGDTWLFYERMVLKGGVGELWAGRLDADSTELREPRLVLKQPWHLSFPNVFRHDGAWYMLPEQAASGDTTLYRSDDFPGGWQPCAQLLSDFRGIDPVVLWRDGRWWLFVTRDGGGPCSDNNLHVFWSESLEGPYQPHPANPVRSGLFGSRMAGPIHEHEGRLIRPAQDGRTGYGAGLVLFEIVKLDSESYVERQISAWDPDPTGPYPKGFHTIHASDGLVVIDGRRIRPDSNDLRWVAAALTCPLIAPFEQLTHAL